MKAEDAIDYFSEKLSASNADQFDVVMTQSESQDLELFESQVKKSEVCQSRGIGVRLFRNKRPGYAYSESFSKPALDQCIADALAHTELTDELKLELPPLGELPGIDLEKYNPELDQVGFANMKEFSLEMEQVAKSGDKRIVNVPYVGMTRTSSAMWLRNSKGANYQTRGNSISAYVGAVAEEKEQKKMGVYSNGSRKLDELDPKFMGETAVERSVELLGASSLEAGDWPVLFSNRISAQIIGMISSSISADSIQKGQSRLAGKVGEQIAVEDFNLRCEPHIIGAPGSRLFDGEGILTKTTSLVENGRFVGAVHNLETANKEGCEPTGHASRGIRGKVGISFSNLRMDKGSRSLEDLLEAYPKLLYITKLEGGSACSAVSGEISIGVQGLLYENGKRIRPVDSCILNTNYFDLIKNIRGLSDAYNDSFSSTKIPDVLVEPVSLAG